MIPAARFDSALSEARRGRRKPTKARQKNEKEPNRPHPVQPWFIQQ